MELSASGQLTGRVRVRITEQYSGLLKTIDCLWVPWFQSQVDMKTCVKYVLLLYASVGFRWALVTSGIQYLFISYFLPFGSLEKILEDIYL
jgi:hypothetical protein